MDSTPTPSGPDNTETPIWPFPKSNKLVSEDLVPETYLSGEFDNGDPVGHQAIKDSEDPPDVNVPSSDSNGARSHNTPADESDITLDVVETPSNSVFSTPEGSPRIEEPTPLVPHFEPGINPPEDSQNHSTSPNTNKVDQVPSGIDRNTLPQFQRIYGGPLRQVPPSLRMKVPRFTSSPAAMIPTQLPGPDPEFEEPRPDTSARGNTLRQTRSLRFAELPVPLQLDPQYIPHHRPIAVDEYGYPIPVSPSREGFEGSDPFKLRHNAPRILLRRPPSRKSTRDSGRWPDTVSVGKSQSNTDGLSHRHQGHQFQVPDEVRVLPGDVEAGITQHPSWTSGAALGSQHPSGGQSVYKYTPFIPPPCPPTAANAPLTNAEHFHPAAHDHHDIPSSSYTSQTAHPVDTASSDANSTVPVSRTPPLRKESEDTKVHGSGVDPSHGVKCSDDANGGDNHADPGSLPEYLISFVMHYGWIALAGVYSSCLLHLPSLYCSRVRKIFEEAQLSVTQLQTMALEMRLSDADARSQMMLQALSQPENLHPSFKFLAFSWEKFVNSLIKEWKTLNITSALLLSAILTLLQIPGAAEDPVTKYISLYSLLCALASLVYGCIYIIRFNTMREPHKAVEWAFQVEGRKGPNAPNVVIWWNVWVLLAMPAVWLTWSLFLYVAAIMTFIWRSDSVGPAALQLTSSTVLAVRVVFSVSLLLVIVYGFLIVATFRQYGEVMDNKWKERVHSHLNAKIRASFVSSIPVSYPAQTPPHYPISPFTMTPGPTGGSSSTLGPNLTEFLSYTGYPVPAPGGNQPFIYHYPYAYSAPGSGSPNPSMQSPIGAQTSHRQPIPPDSRPTSWTATSPLNLYSSLGGSPTSTTYRDSIRGNFDYNRFTLGADISSIWPRPNHSNSIPPILPLHHNPSPPETQYHTLPLPTSSTLVDHYHSDQQEPPAMRT